MMCMCVCVYGVYLLFACIIFTFRSFMPQKRKRSLSPSPRSSSSPSTTTSSSSSSQSIRLSSSSEDESGEEVQPTSSADSTISQESELESDRIRRVRRENHNLRPEPRTVVQQRNLNDLISVQLLLIQRERRREKAHQRHLEQPGRSHQRQTSPSPEDETPGEKIVRLNERNLIRAASARRTTRWNHRQQVYREWQQRNQPLSRPASAPLPVYLQRSESPDSSPGQPAADSVFQEPEENLGGQVIDVAPAINPSRHRRRIIEDDQEEVSPSLSISQIAAQTPSQSSVISSGDYISWLTAGPRFVSNRPESLTGSISSPPSSRDSDLTSWLLPSSSQLPPPTTSQGSIISTQEIVQPPLAASAELRRDIAVEFRRLSNLSTTPTNVRAENNQERREEIISSTSRYQLPPGQLYERARKSANDKSRRNPL